MRGATVVCQCCFLAIHTIIFCTKAMAETALDVHGLSYHLGKSHYSENGHEKSYNAINIG